MKSFISYQHGLAVLLGIAFGVVMFDRGAINFLSPFIVAELHLSNTQLGVAASVVALTWAVSGLLIGRISDITGRRKPFLIAAVVGFSLCSIATGLVGSFAMLVIVRLLMGLGEGPVPPLSTASILAASSPERRGFNVGLFAFFTGLIGSTLAPMILVHWATSYGWRAAFFLAGLPGLVVAALIAALVRERPRATANGDAAAMTERPSPALEVLSVRNVWLCAIIASLLLATWLIAVVFLPLYLVKVRGLTPTEMGMVMTVYGAVGLVGGLLLPTLSDRVGRKPVLAGFSVCALFLPLGASYWTGGTAGLAAIFGLAALAAALPHVAIGMAPGESVTAVNRGTALGLVMGAAEICGGFGGPTLAGWAADRAGLEVIPVLVGACGAAAALLTLALRETAPAVVAARTGALAVALD